MSLPDTLLRSGALTDKDRRDLDAALAAEVDWVALSFIQRPDDIAEARKIVQGRAGIMAKIEKPQALQQLDGIMELVRRDHGGARRPRRGDAARSGAGRAEADDARWRAAPASRWSSRRRCWKA